MGHLPLLLQVCLVRANYYWVSGMCSSERRGPAQPAASSSSSSSPASAPLASAFGTQLPLLKPRHTAGQLLDGRPQRLLQPHHRVHDALGRSGGNGNGGATASLIDDGWARNGFLLRSCCVALAGQSRDTHSVMSGGGGNSGWDTARTRTAFRQGSDTQTNHTL